MPRTLRDVQSGDLGDERVSMGSSCRLRNVEGIAAGAEAFERVVACYPKFQQNVVVTAVHRQVPCT
jgi:trehalose-6-phosphate synthase